jgi:carboxypeptidase family protein
MRRFEWLRATAAGLAAVGLVLPSGMTFAAERGPVSKPAAANQAPTVLDVSLTAEGMLVGQVVDGQGQPLAGTAVTLRGTTGQPISATTGRGGEFQFHRLPGGLYSVTAAQQSGTFRLWTSGSSPASGVDRVRNMAAAIAAAASGLAARAPSGAA